MKKIILNGISLTNKEIYGVQRYATELLYELDKLAKPDEIEVVVPKNGARVLKFKNITVRNVNVDITNHREERMWNWFGFSRYAKKRGGISLDLTLSLPVGGCDIVSVHDCIIERCKQNSNTIKKKAGRLLYILKVLLNTRRAKAVLTLSEYSKKEIVELYHIPKDKILIISCGWQHFDKIAPDNTILERLGLESKPFLFALGSRLYHKNFKWIAEAAKQNPQYTFIVSGSNNLGTSDTSLNKNTKNLIYAGYLSDGEVKALMSHCKAFIQPALYEGFGLPPLEAMSCGARCIVSNRTSLPEVYGHSVWYIDPLCYNNINIDKIMAQKIADNKEVLNKYSWESAAKRLYALLKTVSFAKQE